MLTIGVEPVGDKPYVWVLRLDGELDGSSYQDLIAAAQSAALAGARNLVLEMSACSYMSSAGVMAMHTIIAKLRGDAPSEGDAWETRRAIDREQARGMQTYLALVNPTPRIVRVLELTGLIAFIPVYADVPSAVAAF